MKEYIEREKAITGIDDLPRWGMFGDLLDINDTREMLMEAPAAAVAEVVRCKDCKRCWEKRTKRNKQLMRFCMRMDGLEFQVNANDFCSYGERKEE